MSQFNNELASLSFEEFSSRFDSYVNEIVLYSQDDKLFLAHKLLSNVANSLRRFETQPNHQMEARRMMERLNSRLGTQFEQKLERESHEMRNVLNVMKNQQGWSLVKDSNGIKTYYQNDSTTPIHSIKMIGRINAPLMSILAVIYEIDMYNSWWPLSKDVKEVQRNSKFQKIVRMMLELPWPMWNRDVLFYAYGVDNLEEDQLLIMFRSCTPDEERAANIQPIPKTVRTEWHAGGMLITPISPNETEVCILANVDPKLDFAPVKLINTFTRHLSPLMFERLRHQAVDIIGTEYERRMQANPAVYKEIEERLNHYFQSKQGGRLPTLQTTPFATQTQIPPVQAQVPQTSQYASQYYTQQVPQQYAQPTAQPYAQQAREFPQYIQPQQPTFELPAAASQNPEYAKYFQQFANTGTPTMPQQFANITQTNVKPQQISQYPGGTQLPYPNIYNQYFSK